MGELGGIGRLLIVAGVILALVGVLLLVAPRIPGLDRFGHLPGDITFERGPVTVFVPIVSSILHSIVLTIVLNLLFRR
jgi:hypothetical protein